jgi:hypothetical protein
LDFVAPDLDFVAPDLDFVAAGLDFGVSGLDFGVSGLETHGCIVVRASPTGNAWEEVGIVAGGPRLCPAPAGQSPRRRARRRQPFLLWSESVGRVTAKIALLSDRITGEEERWPRRRLRAVDQDPTGPVQVLCAVAYEGLDLVVREKGEGADVVHSGPGRPRRSVRQKH